MMFSTKSINKIIETAEILATCLFVANGDWVVLANSFNVNADYFECGEYVTRTFRATVTVKWSNDHVHEIVLEYTEEFDGFKHEHSISFSNTLDFEAYVLHL